jgi:class 3 adenylate cyclase
MKAAASFVGRERELTELRSALDSLANGIGQLYSIAGEPGIGKTRLAEEIAAQAARQGARVAWGRCWEGGGAPPFWPWIQVIREFASHLDSNPQPGVLGDTVRKVLNFAADSGASFAERSASSDTAASLSVLQGRATSISDAARFDLFDSLARFFKNLATNGSLVIVLDDIHAADADSLALLRFLAREAAHSAILIIATYRELEARRSPVHATLLAALGTEGRIIRVGGLSEQEVATFVARNAPAAVGDRVVAAMWNATDGNPFFLDETLRLVTASGSSAAPEALDGALPIPDNVREAVRQRAAQLTAPSRKVLEVAAVIGREFDVPLLCRITGLEVGACIDRLEEAVSLVIVTNVQGRAAHYRFSHAMIFETLSDDLPSSRRMQLHLEIARALEEIHQRSYLAETAEHYVRSLPLGPRDKAVAFARLGAADALQRLAYEEGARLYQLAFDASSAALNAEADVLCEISLDLADALKKAGKVERSQAVLERATVLARETQRHDLLAKAALGLTLAYGTEGAALAVLKSTLEQVIGALGEGVSSVKAMAMARLASVLYWSQGRERSLDLSRAAVEMARNVGDTTALIYSLWMKHYALWSPENLDERLRIVHDLIDLSASNGLPYWTMRALEVQLADWLEKGNLHEAESTRARYGEILHQLAIGDTLVILSSAMYAIADGDYAGAERLAEQALAEGQRRQEPGALLSYASQIAMIRYEQGRLAELEPMLIASAEQFPTLDPLRCGIALACIQSGREKEARAQFEQLSRDDFSALRYDWNWLGTMAAVTEACVYLGDRERAARIYTLLLPFADRCIFVGWFEVNYGSVARYLGMLATLLERYDEAQLHFESAIAMHANMRARPLLAHTQYRYGEMICRRANAGDRDRAIELVQTALATADLLGMKALAGRARTLAHKLTISSWPPVPRAPGNLQPPAGIPGLVTVLFVDVVGSTEIAARLGDRQLRDLLSQFYAIARKSFAARNGREVENPGDGFLAVFEQVAPALAAACEIRDAVRELGIEVRAGLHTGECEWLGDQAVGLAVHIGARVAAAANPSDVFVTQTVLDLAKDTSFAFNEAGSHTLKGVPGSWDLYRIV